MPSSVNVKRLYKQSVQNLTGLMFDLFVYILLNQYTSYSGSIALNGHHSELGCNSALYLEGLWSRSWPTVHVFCVISCFCSVLPYTTQIWVRLFSATSSPLHD